MPGVGVSMILIIFVLLFLKGDGGLGCLKLRALQGFCKGTIIVFCADLMFLLGEGSWVDFCPRLFEGSVGLRCFRATWFGCLCLTFLLRVLI